MVLRRKHCRINALDSVASTACAGSVNRDLGPTCLRTESKKETGRLLFTAKIRGTKLLRLFWLRTVRHGPERVSTAADVAVRSICPHHVQQGRDCRASTRAYLIRFKLHFKLFDWYRLFRLISILTRRESWIGWRLCFAVHLEMRSLGARSLPLS